MINISLVLVTIGLVIVTLVYTLATRKMAKEMKHQSDMMQKEFEIRIAPLIELKYFPLIDNVLNPISTITVYNKGFYPVKFEYIYLRCWHRGNPDTAETGVLQIVRWLEKGEKLTRKITFQFSKIPYFSHSWDVKGNGMASVELRWTPYSGQWRGLP
jgi:hypothetical protein